MLFSIHSRQVQATISSPSLTSILPGDVALDALQTILLGTPLNEILTSIARLIEVHSGGMSCSISLLDEDRHRLRYAAAPKLQASYRAATEGRVRRA